MVKLIQKYVDDPSPYNEARLARYMRSHPLAACFATEDELKVLRKLGLC